MDKTCIDIANDLSCRAMTALAIDEYNKDLQFIGYNINNPACSFNNQRQNRMIESELQMTPGTHLNQACANKPSNYYLGPWVNQFHIEKPPYKTEFALWTHPKNRNAHS